MNVQSAAKPQSTTQMRAALQLASGEPPAFVDFGCGRGGSMDFATQLLGEPGIGFDVSAEYVAQARAQCFDAREGDVLTFEGRSVAPVSFAVDLLQQMDGRAAFEVACTNVVRAARDYVVIQHPCFDSAEALLARGEIAPALLDKRVRFRPRVSDYVFFVQAFAARLDIVGLAIFGLGEPRTTALPLSGISSPLLDGSRTQPVFRSLRVLIARKALPRFHTALKVAGSGDALLTWQAAE